MWKAIINYINIKAENLKPCRHDWELLSKAEISNRLNPSYTYFKWTYRCKKCCESKHVESD